MKGRIVFNHKTNGVSQKSLIGAAVKIDVKPQVAK